MTGINEETESLPSSQTLDRAIHILQVVTATRNSGLALADIVEKVGLTKPTARRLLLALMENGLIEQDPVSRKYFSGPETYALGILAGDRFGVLRMATDSLRRLAQRSGDAALLSVQRGTETVCLAREDGNYPLRSHVLQPGDRHPLGCGGSGIALLAALPDEQVHSILEVNSDTLLSTYPHLSIPIIWEQVEQTRELGYAFNKGLVFKGSWGVAVAVVDPRGGLPSSLAIAGVESRFADNRHEELVAMLNEEKAFVEARMGRVG
ncbi:IclR family transcriptional regulator [Lampropedia puyangensis]|uniref:IclR family transcriptional regulator n=1 Tax=Lampropedia puyangensis TaxID=1330072 RepID=A0A4S8F3U2_9BURK|nr:IclR family transcriptional regulator [Lampropedia puyangensis]THU02030.1 IclR family transcriptional regulator [Lampropedia puyangensis]